MATTQPLKTLSLSSRQIRRQRSSEANPTSSPREACSAPRSPTPLCLEEGRVRHLKILNRRLLSLEGEPIPNHRPHHCLEELARLHLKRLQEACLEVQQPTEARQTPAQVCSVEAVPRPAAAIPLQMLQRCSVSPVYKFPLILRPVL